MSTIKFFKHYVTDGRTKARVRYSLDNRADGQKCVTLYAKDYTDALRTVFGPAEYTNDTDTQTDYFDKGRVNLFEESPDYAAARERAEVVLLGRASASAAKHRAYVASQPQAAPETPGFALLAFEHGRIVVTTTTRVRGDLLRAVSVPVTSLEDVLALSSGRELFASSGLDFPEEHTSDPAVIALAKALAEGLA